MSVTRAGIPESEGLAEKGIPLALAMGIFLAVVLGVTAFGMAIGYRFFWGHETARPDVMRTRWEAVIRAPRDALGWTELGVALYERENLTQAEKNLLKALELDPAAARAAYYLGMVYLKEEKYDDAIRVLREITRRDAANPLAFMQLAKAYIGKKDYQQALEMLDYLVQYVDPYFIPAHYERGQVLEMMGRRQDAIAAYRRVEAMDPEFLPAAEALRRLGAPLSRFPWE